MKFSKEEIQNSMLLYAVTDRMWLKDGEGLTDVCRKVLENGATFLQIREKDLDENTFEQEAEALKELCASYRVPYVVNDSVEIAMDIDADGVHVGQSDIKGRDIRAMIGPDKILGISAGTVEEAQALFILFGHALDPKNNLVDAIVIDNIRCKEGIEVLYEECEKNGVLRDVFK